MTSYRLNQGAALISMLLVFALVTILVSSQTGRISLSIKTTQSISDAAQAWQHILSGEMYGRYLLRQDIVERSNTRNAQQDSYYVDHYYENWHDGLRGFTPDEGTIEIVIEDLQGRFNLNNLRQANGEIDLNSLDMLKRIFRQNNISERAASNIADWLDANDRSIGHASEDHYYSSLTPPYLSPGKPVSDPSESLFVNTVPVDKFKQIEEHFTALPTRTTININTASPIVIAALTANVLTTNILEKRRSLPNGFRSIAQFNQDSTAAGLDLSKANLGVSSNYFLITTRASINGYTITVESTIFRDNRSQKTQVIARKIIPFKDFDKQYL